MGDIAAVSYSGTVKIYKRSHLGRVTRTTGLAGLSLDIRKGEIFGLLGLNGAGKTTAMKLLAGLLFADSGGVSVFGFPPGSDGARRAIGYLPELPYFYSALTPVESLEFYGRLSGLKAPKLRERVAYAMESAGLAKHSKKRLSEFSKGMLQRVGLAQAILHDPELIVLDEPVSGLDPLAVRDFRETLLSLNKAGKTIFLSSHSISEVEKICHRVAILREGSLAALVPQEQWRGGGLEEIFVNTVRNAA